MEKNLRLSMDVVFFNNRRAFIFCPSVINNYGGPRVWTLPFLQNPSGRLEEDILRVKENYLPKAETIGKLSYLITISGDLDEKYPFKKHIFSQEVNPRFNLSDNIFFRPGTAFAGYSPETFFYSRETKPVLEKLAERGIIVSGL